MTYEQEKRIERKICAEMLQEAFHKLRITEQCCQIHHNDLPHTSYKWKNLLDRMKTNSFYYVLNVRCVVSANIVGYIQDIEQIRLLILEESCKRELEQLK